MPENLPDPNLTALEAALASLTPAPGRIDRDRLLFRAGQASVTRRRWLWPASTGLMASAAATLCFLLLARPDPAPVERVVFVRVEPPEAPAPKTASSPPASRETAPSLAAEDTAGATQVSYFRLQDQVLRWGLDALPSPPPAAVTEPLLTDERAPGAKPTAGNCTPSSFFDRLLNLGGQS
jgi:hypothetical protein